MYPVFGLLLAQSKQIVPFNRRHVVKIVILGCGRVGAILATMMDTAGHKVSIIDYSSEVVSSP